MTAALSGTIARTDLSLSPLGFGDGSGLSLYIGGLLLGRRSWRRSTVSSPFVVGETEVAAVLDQTQDAELHFRVKQTTESATLTMVTALVAAVEQRKWDLIVTVGSTAWPTVTCTRAETEVLFDLPHIRGHVATVNVYTTHGPSTGAL